jgi:glucose/arabinose dehydrogenase
MRHKLIALVLALPLLAIPIAAQQAAGTSQVLDAPGGKIRVTTVASGLFHPFSLAFLPDGGLLVAEKNGPLRLIRNGILLPDPVWKPTAPASANDALHFVAVHPQFAQNRLVYVSYPKTGERGSTLAISRGRLDGNTLTNLREIFVADAWETHAASN